MTNNKDIHVIIPAAGKPTNKIISHTTLPDTMLPINGKPVIGYILENLIDRGICNVTIILNQSDSHTEYYVKKKFDAKITLYFERNTEPERGVGYSISYALKNASDKQSILVYLGDTIYKGELDFSTNFLITTTTYETPEKWCFVEEHAGVQSFINKPTEYTEQGRALAGLYYFKEGQSFSDILTDLIVKQEKIEIHHILAKYNNPFSLVPASQYYDCGNIENYYKAKIDFIKTRSFNTVIYDDLHGTITKTGRKKEKLLDEINWYKNTPNDLKIFSPRLLDSSVNSGEVSYKIEYYGYQSLADYFLFNHLDKKLWAIVIDRILDILALFKEHHHDVPFTHFDEMYKNKTLARITELKASEVWVRRFTETNININGTQYNGWPYFENRLQDITNHLYKHAYTCFVHGDPCLSNILFDPHNKIIKMIDPRGSFGETSIYGDHNYDLAKLRHSLVGKYDFIVSDLFDVKEINGDYSLSVYNETYHDEVGIHFDETLRNRGYNVEAITLI